MKNKWGFGIAIFYISFVVVMVGFVVYSKGLNYDLVRDDYYQGDIDFQKQKDKIANANKLTKDLYVSFDKQTKEVFLDFPKEMSKISGKIQFYRPNDKKKDFNVNIKTDENNIQKISVSGKLKGVWKLNVDWQGDKVKYFKQEELFF